MHRPRGAKPAADYRRAHPGIDIRICDTDLTGPTCGLRTGLVDVALTRAPFDELRDRRWFQFPQGTDPIWQSYRNGGTPREGSVVRAVQECPHTVLWNGRSVWLPSDTFCPRS